MLSDCNNCCLNNNYMMHKWDWLATLIMWFIIFLVLFWLIFYSLQPGFVLKNNTKEIDTAKVLLSAVIASLILIIIIIMIKAILTCKFY